MQLNRRTRRVGQDGFTLIELIITVAILGVVVVSLTGVLIQYLKVSGATQSRLTESTDQQFVSAYWQQDVSSLGLHGFTPDTVGDQLPLQRSVWTTGSAPSAVPSGCTTGLPGTVVIGFAWNDYPGTTDPFTTWNATVNATVYVSRQVGTTSRYELRRVRCVGNTTSTILVAHNLTKAPDVSCITSSGAADSGCGTSSGASAPPRTVSMTIDVRSADNKSGVSTGYTTTLTAQRRQG